MAQIELKEGDVIVKQDELNQLLQEREHALTDLATRKEAMRKQEVLINQASKVVASVQKLVPGLFDGRGFQGIDFASLMNGDTTKHLTPDCELLKKLMDEYNQTKPVILNAHK